MEKYYLYRHIRVDKNEPFYIGIGTKSEQDLKYGYYGRASAKHVDNNIWLKIIAKTEWRWEILLESDDRKFISEKEKEFILLYGRKCDNSGTLANLTLGGEENHGYKHTDEAKKKISEVQKGKPGRRLGAKLTSEQCEKFSEIQKEVANRPEMLEFRKERMLGNTYMLGKTHSDESKKKMSESAKKRGINAKTIKCKLIDKLNDLSWEANSITALSKISPISLSTLNRMSNNIKVSKKISDQYQLIKYE